MHEDVDLLLQYADSVVDRIDSVVLLGMGGSSLAPEVLRRTFRQETFHVLDTTHPQAIRDLEAKIDVARTLFIVRVEVGLDARDPLAHGLLLGAEPKRRALGCDHRPRLGPRGARAGAGLRRDLRRRPGDRRALLRAVGVRDGARGADGRRRRAVPAAGPGDGRSLPARPRATPASSSASRSARAGRRAATRSASHRTRAASACGPSSCSPSRPASRARA